MLATKVKIIEEVNRSELSKTEITKKFDIPNVMVGSVIPEAVANEGSIYIYIYNQRKGKVLKIAARKVLTASVQVKSLLKVSVCEDPMLRPENHAWLIRPVAGSRAPASRGKDGNQEHPL